MKKTKVTTFAVTALLCTQNLWAAKLAIVIDDIGYRKNDSKIFQMDKNISVAIIPSSPHAVYRDKEAFNQGRDILIHMPMDSGITKIEPEVIRIGMTKEKIRSLIDYAKTRVPHAIGLNNHMGGRGTGNEGLMQDFIDVFKTENKFVLDSFTIGHSYLGKKSREAGLVTFKRDVFLDHENSYEFINNAFSLAIKTARKNGFAIAIGHPRTHTIAVLQQRLKNLPADIELVRISSLAPPKKVDNNETVTALEENPIAESTAVTKPEIPKAEPKIIIKTEQALSHSEDKSFNATGMKQWLQQHSKTHK